MRRLVPLLLLLAPAALADAPAPSPAWKIIVNKANPADTLTRKFVGDALLKKTTRWPSGNDVIRPVDLSPSSPVRERVAQDLLGRSVAAVKSYWEQSIFSGRETPPPELDGDDAVIAFVVKYPWAIGYVSSAADVKAVKVISVR